MIEIKKLFNVIIFLILFVLFIFQLVSAVTSYKGSLHQHTGFSTTIGGYDGNILTGDNCGITLELHFYGENVTELRDQAINLNLDYLGFSDHSYCVNSSEFDIVKTDCENVRNNTFSCLIGEELSTSDIYEDNEEICIFNNMGEAHLGGYGISSFINQTPSTAHCPTNPTAQGGVIEINNQGGISILNHPQPNEGFLDFESMFDVVLYTGIEMWNSNWGDDDQDTIENWTGFLLNGKKVFAYSGTDEHEGVSIDNYNVAYINGNFNYTNLQDSLKQGYSSVSNTGEMYVEIYDSKNGIWRHIGETFNVCKNDTINITIDYNLILGFPCNLKLYKGIIGESSESYWDFGKASGINFNETQSTITNNTYFRAECINSTTNRRVYTNPIWMNTVCCCQDWTAGSCGGGGCTSPKRQYTRTCNPSGCSETTKCEYDVSCETGGGSSLEITVCVSGCNYTSIQNAINHSDENDKVLVMDNRTYNEQIVMNSTTAGRLECQNGSVIKGSNTGTGIYLKGMDGFIVIGCKIDSFNYGIFSENSSHADIINVIINNSRVIGLLLKDDSFDIRMKNISVLETTGDNAIRFEGYGWSGNIVSNNKIEDSIIRKSGAAELVWINWGIYNDFLRSNFSESASGYEGILLNGHNNIGYHDIYDNNIFNNNIGIYFKDSKTNNINGNNFCPSNTDNDFSISGLSIGNSGSNNHCEKPGTWNDTGATGCTYYCDNPPLVTLLYPPNNFIDYNGNAELVCQSTDDYQLVNITLYHNINGTWLSNQTQGISGTSNITIFNVDNILDETSFIWNCLSYDNKSRASFASANWSINISIYPNDTNKFYIKDDLNENLAWLGDLGNIVLKGSCFFNTTCDNPGNDSFIIRNITNDNVAFINSTGDLCIEKGDCSDESATCNPSRDAVIVRNMTNHNMSYIDFDGELCLTGKLYENLNI